MIGQKKREPIFTPGIVFLGSIEYNVDKYAAQLTGQG